jgi:hypothetical protein
MYKFIGLLIILIFIDFASAQQDVNKVLDYTLSYRGLTREDVTIPIDFFDAAEKSPTNDSKLLLPIVRDIMINPLRSMTWIDSLEQLLNSDLESTVQLLYSKGLSLNTRGLIICPVFIDEDEEIFGDDLVFRIKHNRNRFENLSKPYSPKETDFLNKNLFSIFEESDNDDTSNFDIFKYNKLRDSSISISKRTMDLLSRIDISKSCMDDMSIFTYLYQDVVIRKNYTKKWNLNHYSNKNIEGDFYYYYDEDDIRIAVGGPGKNVYNGRFDIIIDFGGDDVYNIDNDKPLFSKDGQGSFSGIIDLSGNDYYTTKSNFALAGALFSSSFIFDKEGDDYYNCQSVGLGAAIGGLGLLYDESGNDTYHGLTFSIGAGCFGVGLVVDRKGNDTYIANSYSQGFGMTEGVGAIIDNEGNDSYLIDARSLDIGRYEDHYVSMCQGYGLGLRPYYAGGIGLIIEGSGNDIYNTDIFGQGGAYWYSLGAIVDKSGHDKYNGYQYSQGAGIHLAVGLLKDYDGWDFYQSQGVSQGCGHDFGFGLLWDVKGNDNYSAYSLSQGAGNADGIGILIDESGSDGYLSKEPVYMSRGYGNPRREYGSIGLFLDMSGNDFYSVAGLDSSVYNSPTWGVRNDYFLKDLPEQTSGDNFKVALDTEKTISEYSPTGSFTAEQYFIMASTIEPRFSQWQEYGFNKLVENSSEAAQYVLTRLGTDDHRAVQVMRVLSKRMGTELNNALVNQLKNYSDGKIALGQAEVSLACYLLGEIGSENGKDILLTLTYDGNIRIRSSAINTLGKIKIDSEDENFMTKVANRLIELVNENSDKKLYNKDIAYTFSKYSAQQNLDALVGLLSNKFYGARFLASNALQEYWKLYGAPDNSILLRLEPNMLAFQAFLYSLVDLPDEKFKPLVEQITTLPIASDEIVNMNLIDLLKVKKSKSIDENYKNYYSGLLTNLELKSLQKVK